MTLAELEQAEKCMQQQWHDLVTAEQQGNSLEVLEQMYDTYILLAEEYNRCCETYHRENQGYVTVDKIRQQTYTLSTS